MTKDKATIIGNYGVEVGELVDPFKIILKEVKPASSVTPVKPEVKPMTPITPVNPEIKPLTSFVPIKPEVKPVIEKKPVGYQLKNYSFDYTKDTSNSREMLNQEHPVRQNLSWFDPLIGVS